MRKNTVTIKLLQNLTPLEFKLVLLRFAKNINETETINHTQLGRLKTQKIKFEVI